MSVAVRNFSSATRMEVRDVSSETQGMTKRIRPRRNGQRGGAAVEFAIVLPLFCAVLFGIIDYGWFYYQRFTVAAAIRDGLRTGVTVSQSLTKPNDYSTIAIARAENAMKAAGITPEKDMFTTSTSDNYPKKALTLTANYTFKPLVNFVPLPKKAQSYAMTMMFELQQQP
jgi:Flp pilus assembly protein TadG